MSGPTKPGGDPDGPPEECVVEVDGTRYDVRVYREPAPGAGAARPRRRRSRGGIGAPAHGPIVAPIPGNVMRVDVAEGDVVEAGQILCVLEAMKMENELTAPAAGIVSELAIEAGDLVSGGQQLLRIDAAPS